jgi:diguanylate cyclase (GGDEF)-like protein
MEFSPIAARAADAVSHLADKALELLNGITAPLVSRSSLEIIGALGALWDHGHPRWAALTSAFEDRGVALAAPLTLALAATMALAAGWLIRRTARGLLRLAEQIRASSRALRDSRGHPRKTHALETPSARLQAPTASLHASDSDRIEQLTVALENMSQGLCMFDHCHRLVVRNRRFEQIYGLDHDAVPLGTHLWDVWEACKDAGTYTSDQLGEVEADLARQLRTLEESISLETLKDGRVISVARVPLPDGGWVTTFEDVTERKRAESQIEHMALHDSLTGLPNRTSFRQRLIQAVAGAAPHSQVAVLYLDLDHFKAVNDTLGHPIGDMLLQHVADRLRACLAPSGLVARLGGDEFAIILRNVVSPEQPEALAQRIIDALNRVFDIQGHRIVIGTSVGIAFASSNDIDPDTTVKSADLALYHAKSEGRNTFSYFEPEMATCLQARRALEVDLRSAIEKGELELHYQPIVTLRTNHINCFEAVLRWRHPTRGSVAPDEFIPLAEDIGLIGQIGAQVLFEACRAAMSWPGDVRVAVNLSPVQVRSQTLAQEIGAALDASGLAPDRLELEITETVLLEDTKRTLSVLGQVRALGVRIAMDDFGTGYSSLNYLRTFPFDKIKIDRSFIADLTVRSDAQAIVRAISALAASLGMATTAEGVETQDQLQFLRSEGCTEVQGYIISAAVRAEAVMPLLAKLEASMPRLPDSPARTSAPFAYKQEISRGSTQGLPEQHLHEPRYALP